MDIDWSKISFVFIVSRASSDGLGAVFFFFFSLITFFFFFTDHSSLNFHHLLLKIPQLPTPHPFVTITQLCFQPKN